jgi:hypothetical protein
MTMQILSGESIRDKRSQPRMALIRADIGNGINWHIRSYPRHPRFSFVVS